MNKSRDEGFTVVELLVVITVTAIVSVVYLGMVSSYFVVINRNNKLVNMTIDSQNLMRTTVENIRFGDGVRQTNQISDANAPAGGWNTSNSSFVIVIAIPALTVHHDYIIDSSTGSPYMNELVYYKNGSDLMERKLANPSATGNNFQTTCPSNLASSSCPADPTLANYVNSMSFVLYDQDGATTTTPSSARSVKINLSMQQNAPGNPITVSNSIQVTLRNRF